MKYSGPAITQVKTAISFGSECSNHSGVANNIFSFAVVGSYVIQNSYTCHTPISSFCNVVRFFDITSRI